MYWETDRLIITRLTMDMARDVHENSLDADTRKYLPDEVFETPEEARETVAFLMTRYDTMEGPLVYGVLTKAGHHNAGYVQLVPLEGGAWEVGCHMGEKYTGNGYATEAVKAFLPAMDERLGLKEVYGISLKENIASCRVLEKCGFETLFAGMGTYQGRQREIVRSVWREKENGKK